MNINAILLALLYILSFLTVVSAIKTLINKRKVERILKYLNTVQFSTFNTKNCYYSAIGLHKNYPSYPCKLDIYLTENEVFFIGKKRFPFIFKTYEIPFSLSANPAQTQAMTKIDRVFRPTKVYLDANIFNVNFIDHISGRTEIDFQVSLQNAEKWEELRIVNDWRKHAL